MKQVTIELDCCWASNHRDDNPIDFLKNKFSTEENIDIISTSLHSLVLYCRDEGLDCDELKEKLIRLLSSVFPTEDFYELLHIFSEQKELEEETEPLDNIFDDMDIQDGWETNYDDPVMVKGPQDVLDEIEKLVGAQEFKNLAKEIILISKEIMRTNAYPIFNNQSYLFSIGDGCGMTTYLELFADLIFACDLSKYRPSVCEFVLGSYKESREPFEHAYEAIGKDCLNAPKIISIDISEWMNHTDTHYFKEFLHCIEKSTSFTIVVFRVPFVEKDILSKIIYSLSDLLTIRTLSFSPFSQEDLQKYATTEFKKIDFTVEQDAWQYFFNRITEEKSDGRFYGMNTAKKVVWEIIYKKFLSNANSKVKSTVITAGDTQIVCKLLVNSHLSAMEQLNKMIGIDSVKQRVLEIVAQIETAVKDNIDRPCIHMRFVGNPGTGKTTVARIVGSLLKEKGILRTGAFFEYSGRDFCGRYIGETAPKTAIMCRDAYGSVLFIDEAYSLYRGDNNDNDFGREALDTLIAEMENHRNDFVVIMAGYTDEMETLLKGNYGLASRMPYTITFPNYSRDQLYDIFVSMVQSTYAYENAIFGSAREFFNNIPENYLTSKDFSNARFVRNLVERTRAKASMRTQLSGEKITIIKRDDFLQASADSEFSFSKSEKQKIGF